MFNFILEYKNRYNLFNAFDNKLFNYNLIYFLYNSYNKFFQFMKNEKYSLYYILNKTFPLKLNDQNLLINYIDHEFIIPNKDYYYCIKMGLSYYCKLKIKFCFSEIKDSKSYFNCENIHVANIPIMTENGTFVIGGIEKTIVSKFVRSNGFYLFSEIPKNSKFLIFCARILLEFFYDLNFIINNDNFLILKVRQIEISLIHFLRFLGLNNKDIINNFYEFEKIIYKNNNFYMEFKEDYFLNLNLSYDIIDEFENILVKKNTLINEEIIDKIKFSNISLIKLPNEYLLGKFIFEDIFYNNKIIAKAIETVDNNLIFYIKKYNINIIKIIHVSSVSHYSIINSLLNNNCSFLDSLNHVNNFYNSIGFCVTNINLNFLNIKKSFKNFNFIDISSIRKQMNFKLKRVSYYGSKFLTLIDFIDIIKALISLKDNLILPDDMYSLGSLNLITSGDMLYNIFYKFFLNIKKNVSKIKFDYIESYIDLSFDKFLKFQNINLDINNLFINSKFSQFLDQVNILSELSHKRKVSFLGILGVSKKHSSFNVRDLNLSSYSRLCPVETPEGLNIGLVGSLALFSLIGENKLLTSPYYKIKNNIINKKINYLNYNDELDYVFTDSNLIISKFNNKNHFVNARFNNQLIRIKSELVNYIDVFPYQILSVSASLVPFIEHNDSNRALMASNMLKQALPCLRPERPIVATGIELLVGLNSKTVIKSKNFASIEFVDSENILLNNYVNFKGMYLNFYKSYSMYKYRISNQNTDISQRPIVNVGDKINHEDILIDGNCTDNGELSLGQNMIVAFMNWGGYNFEDSIIVSEKVLIDDRYTSLELSELDVSVYKNDKFYDVLSNDFFTFDKKKILNLDNFGLIKIGSLVSSGDLLVGKITRYYNSKLIGNLSNEDKFINCEILKENIDYVDSSFYLPDNFNLSTVNNIEVYFSENYNLSLEDELILNLQSEKKLQRLKLKFKFFYNKLINMIKDFLNGRECFNENKRFKIDYTYLNEIDLIDLSNLVILDNDLNLAFTNFLKRFNLFLDSYEYMMQNIKIRFMKNLPIGISKLIKIFFIKKKRLQLGDKMSGRHGNKGVISKILPINEMPFMANGMTVDVILNPLGVPSRMNIGQLLEIHLGLVSLLVKIKISDLLSKNNIQLIKNFLNKIFFHIYGFNHFTKNYSDNEILNTAKSIQNGLYFNICNFNKFKEDKINNLLNSISSDFTDIEFGEKKNQIHLYDGKSGKKFDNPITVGIMYMLKLNHLAEDKMHSRSIGPYSLVTQQPVKGKSNTGGQRLGEMEVWALEAYGASFTLRDMLTIKSDDINGRNNLYKNIIDGLGDFTPGRPESFNVMLNNINCLGIYIRFVDK